MKQFIAVIFFLFAASGYAQKHKKEPEVFRDAFVQFAFHESSMQLTNDGLQQLIKFSEWYLSNSKDGFYHVYLSGIATESELVTDSFLGVKRCKVILDSLAENGIDTGFFFITRDKIEGKGGIGVGLIIDTKSRVMPEPTEEDDYFKDKKNKRKKG